MKLSIDDYLTIAKVGAVVFVGVYLYQRGIFGALGDAVGAAAGAVGKVAEKAAGAATKNTSMDVNGSIEIYKEGGLTEEQAKWLEALALGNLGA